MKRDGFLSRNHHRFRLPWRHLALGLAFGAVAALPVWAADKEGMPDLSQIDQTCLPTSTANLILWFGKHGYPKLILGDATESEDDRDLHTVHRLMADTDARFDWGTRLEKVTLGIRKYIQDAGYDGDVEYRGLGGKVSFTPDWLKDNDDPNKGFILLLGYCHYDRDNQIFSSAWGAGHAVTLINAQPDMILVNDPAHQEDETGRKILTPQVLTVGVWQDVGTTAPVSGLMLLSGSLLEAPPNSEVLLIGAVCVTMHPANASPGSSSPAPANGVPATIAGTSPSPAPAPPKSDTTGWFSGLWWLLDLLFKK